MEPQDLCTSGPREKVDTHVFHGDRWKTLVHWTTLKFIESLRVLWLYVLFVYLLKHISYIYINMYDRYYLFQIALDYIRYIQSPMTTGPFLGFFIPHLFVASCWLANISNQRPAGTGWIQKNPLTTGPPKSKPCHLWAQLQTRDSEDLEWLGRSKCRSECCRCNLATLEVTLHWTAEVLLSTGHVGNANQSAVNYMCSPDKASPVWGWRYKPWICLKELERPTNTWEMICFGPGNFENWNFASFLVALILTQCVWLASSSSTSSRCIAIHCSSRLKSQL